jgi:hypothetical protein
VGSPTLQNGNPFNAVGEAEAAEFGRVDVIQIFFLGIQTAMTMPSPAFSNRREMKRPFGGIGLA